jgi:monoamine oxidase
MKNNSKTILFSTFRKALRMALAANKTGMTAEEIIQRTEDSAMTRRKFLENTGKTALITGLIGLNTEGVLGRSFSLKNPPRVVIVGAGIAGLNTLHTFKKAGLDATIYESSGRIGGRIFTVQNVMGEGTWTEFGGEFIDTDHADMRTLAKEFNLELIDYTQASEEKLTKEAFFFNGKHHTMKEVVGEFRQFADKIKADADRLPDEMSVAGYKIKDAYLKKLDRMSLSQYLEKIGARGWIKEFIEVAYESEYGLSPQVQSAINLPILISTETEGDKLELFGESDERYKVRGGNQSIPDALAKKYMNHIELNRSLEAINRNQSDEYELTFSGLSTPIKADFVVMTIPFSRLKNVDIRLKMPQLKWDSINTMGFGTNAKLMLGMKNHYWRELSYQGLCYSDIGIPNGWDNAQLQTGDNEAAGLSILFGGPSGIAVGKGSPESQKDIYLPKWNRIFKGANEHFNGKVARMHWPSYPHALGSYICYRTGQYTSIGGAEAIPVGNLFFAGEHCGGDFSGFMNGAAKSGREAAEAILLKLKYW